MKKLLVMGVGNILLTDEGAGVWAVQELQKEEWPENIDLMDGGTFTQDIFHLLEGYDALVVLDIVHSGKEPGVITVFEEEDLISNEKQRLSLYDIDLLDSLKMAETLGKRPKMRIIGIEPKSYTDWAMEMTEELQAAFPAFVDTARKEIKRFLDGDF